MKVSFMCGLKLRSILSVDVWMMLAGVKHNTRNLHLIVTGFSGVKSGFAVML